jgi:hypothetical protein
MHPFVHFKKIGNLGEGLGIIDPIELHGGLESSLKGFSRLPSLVCPGGIILRIIEGLSEPEIGIKFPYIEEPHGIRNKGKDVSPLSFKPVLTPEVGVGGTEFKE